MKKFISTVLLAFTTLLLYPQDNNSQSITQKVIDEGGSGLFKAMAVKEKSLPQFVVYRPNDLYWASTREKKLPVLIWGNGGCMDTSVGYERMLTEIASQGYIVIAIGEIQRVYGDRKEVHTPSEMMVEAMNWICKQVKDKSSSYYDCVDTTRMAAAGHSCGGAQVLFNSADARLKTYLILNAGMGDMEMAGASKSSLAGLHGPILYLTGGESDVAYKNAQLDYERITQVPVAYADMSVAGHGGTYKEKGGGDFGRMVLAWLHWQLKGKTQQKNVFLESDLRAFPGWTMKQKNFGTGNTIKDLWINISSRKIYGIVSEPTSSKKKGVAVICHGFNGTHHFGRDYFKTLNELGYIVYTFDFPCGSVNSRSDNNTMNMSAIDEKEDVKAIVQYFRQQPEVDKDKIVLIGESQGGFVSALAAAELKEQISRLVLVYPALSIPDNWNKRYPEVRNIPDTTKLWNIPMGRRFFLELRNINVYKTITQYKGPVQIIHGSQDAVIPLSYSEEAMKQYKQAHLGVIPGAGHGFKPAEREVSNQFVKEFLSK